MDLAARIRGVLDARGARLLPRVKKARADSIRGILPKTVARAVHNGWKMADARRKDVPIQKASVVDALRFCEMI
jgi:hypothetical protein